MTGGTGSCRYMAPENYWYQVSLHMHAAYVGTMKRRIVEGHLPTHTACFGAAVQLHPFPTFPSLDSHESTSPRATLS